MSLVKQALIVEFKELAQNALKFKNEMEGAKTYVKREIFKKKLVKNNKKAAEILSALETLAKKEAEKLAGANDETFSNEGRTETPSGISPPVE